MTDDATRAQIAAADPRASTWLSANAGSGKTRVLTDRVARLLLDGAKPQNILCLTYTKAAAGEMQNRLFRTLGSWSMMDDPDLRDTLNQIGAASDMPLSKARTLFARAIETPGGLKIQTIHSFCAALLRQFPLEAGVSPGFSEMDESAQRHVLADVMERLAEDDPGGAVSGFARFHGGHEVEKTVAEIVGRRGDFAAQPNRPALLAAYDAPEDLTPDRVISALALDGGLIARLCNAMKSGGASDLRAFDALSSVNTAAPGLADLAVLEGCLLTGAGAKEPFASKAGKFPTKAVRKAITPTDLDALDDLIDRVAGLRPLRLALAAADRTLALHAFAAQLIPAYVAEKTRRGWLDFDDLIERTGTLLSDSASAAWVLYKLDGRIDHILVDESQDTSPAQWRIVEFLTAEFGAGEGVRESDGRTLFVVGDKKQSIYSFQGADAEAFEAMRTRFADQLQASGGMAERELLHSFRSAPAILRAVDATFAGAAGDGLGGEPRHLAFHDDRPGRVDLWPLVPPSDKPEKSAWYNPVDLRTPDNPSAQLSRTIANRIREMLNDPECLIGDGPARRRLRAEDVLLLVRGRTGQGDLFQSLIRALKVAGLPVAGADVMRLDEELAVRDLKALLAFLALPEDSLSLAAVLRSPIFGWGEADLYDLAAKRDEKYLWRALETRADEFPETLAILRDLRDRSDYLRPYDLLERVLVRHDGRRRLKARLGDECEDAIDEMLSLALNYERQEVPSLTGFLAWLDGEATEVKRALDQSGGAIRVMTVHGAKGLESPVVILPDTMRTDQRQRGELVTDARGDVHWPPARDDRPAAISEALEAAALSSARERQRLLYVAMTRAESWLIVCGAGDGEKDTGTWYGDVRSALGEAGAVPVDTPLGEGLRLETGDWSLGPAAAPVATATSEPPLPEWAGRPADPPRPRSGTLSPSDLGGAKALPGDGRSEEEALRHGRRVHLLFEHLAGLAPERHPETAVALLSHGEDAADEALALELAKDVSAVLAGPDPHSIFANAALAEVEVSAALPELNGQRIHGVIDRLVIGDDSVLVVDFKTNAVVPDTPQNVPEGILRQMGAYRSALLQVYPGREIETAVLWTTTGAFMVLPNEIVMCALARSATS